MSLNKGINMNEHNKIIPKYVVDVKISYMKEHGRKEINNKEELENFPIGSLISYVNKKGEFRQGGYIIKFAEDYFIYLSIDFSTKYRVRYKNVKQMWVGDVYSVHNDIVSLQPSQKKKTNFPVIVNSVTVYYAKNNFDLKRWQNTHKYKNLIKWCEYFINP